jgi:3',5'-cyclic-nucleotide phosphodiesterase
MENQVGMETTLFGGPPEIGNVMKLANGQIGFMTIFAHPLFANVTDVIPAMGFAAAEILNNKGVWITRIEQEKRKQQLRSEGSFNDGAVSPRSQSPVPKKPETLNTTHSASTGYFPASPLRHASNPPSPLHQQIKNSRDSSIVSISNVMAKDDKPTEQSEAPSWRTPFLENGVRDTSNTTSPPQEATPTSSGVLPNAKPHLEARRPQVQTRKSSNTVPHSLQVNGLFEPQDESTTTTTASSVHEGDYERTNELRKSNYTTASVPLIYDDSISDLRDQQRIREEGSKNMERTPNPEPPVPVSKYCLVPSRPYSQIQSQTRNSGRMSVPTSTDRNSMATSGAFTHSTNLSTTLSPSTEATSFLSVESSEDLVEDRGNGPFSLKKPRDSNRDRAKSSPSMLPEVVPSDMMGRVPPPMGSGSSRTKSPIKTSTAVVREARQQEVSTWDEGDGDKSMRRRISRLRFWRKKTDEDEK